MATRYNTSDTYTKNNSKNNYYGADSSIGTVAEECSIVIYHANKKSPTHTFKIPCYPDSIQDQQSANWADQTIVGRFAPISSYAGLNYRSVNYSFILHRDMMPGSTTIEEIIRGIRATQYPIYKGGVIPPTIFISCGDFRIRGITRSYNYTWEKPIINKKYQVCTISLTVDEVPETTVDARSIISSEANITRI